MKDMQATGVNKHNNTKKKALLPCEAVSPNQAKPKVFGPKLLTAWKQTSVVTLVETPLSFCFLFIYILCGKDNT